MTEAELLKIIEHYVPNKADKESVVSAIWEHVELILKTQSLELLNQLLKREHEAYQESIEDYTASSEHSSNIEAIDKVIDLVNS